MPITHQLAHIDPKGRIDSSRNSSSRAVGGRAKRCLDLIAAVTVLTILSPLFLMVGATVALTSPGPILYGHSRIGFGGRSFKCWKFRTMCQDGDAVLAEHLADNDAARREWELTRKLKDDPRVTTIGRVLREYSVDELPQLLNVIRGDMSLVGPRPVVQAELENYNSHAGYYLSARPGITGLWQVSGRNDVSYDHRVRLDVSYVADWSLSQDIAIMARTIPAVVASRGAY
ncbi:sugar transferase [Pseudoruegeria sp. HB172150]|uniref:sugar transferase n=1 Tax=Pseudoruegeria sp. HB172150 TaxID=2721164 RepID=UPI001553D82A|nr:sugar transferase [Pseudoruegeria sp. HB172150]